MRTSEDQQERRRLEKLWRKRREPQGPGTLQVTWARGLSIIAALLLVFYVMYSCERSSVGPIGGDQHAHKLHSIVSIIHRLPEVQWVETDDNTIYIGFSDFPDDTRQLIRAWALQANAKTGFGVHVWAVQAVRRGWRPGEPGRFITTTARGGTIRE